MGVFELTTAGIYRHTSDGRRILSTGYPRRQFVVPDEARASLELRVKRQFQAVMALVLAGILVSDWLGWSWPWLALPAVLLPVVGRGYVPRGLTRIQVPREQLVPVDRRHTAIARARAMGRPTILALLVGALGLAVLGAAGVFLGHDPWGWGLVAMWIPGSIYFAVLFRRARPDGAARGA